MILANHTPAVAVLIGRERKNTINKVVLRASIYGCACASYKVNSAHFVTKLRVLMYGERRTVECSYMQALSSFFIFYYPYQVVQNTMLFSLKNSIWRQQQLQYLWLSILITHTSTCTHIAQHAHIAHHTLHTSHTYHTHTYIHNIHTHAHNIHTYNIHTHI